jgi:hypothetical protein
MTLWDRRLGLILGLAFFIFACEDPGEIGLELNPENGTFVAKYDEISIKSSIIEYEDILSDNSTRIEYSNQNTGNGRLLTGNYSNQDFGAFQSKAFSSVYLGAIKFRPSENAVFDSLVFYVKVDYLYGEDVRFIGNKKIFVHELEDEIKLDSLYLTKNSTPYSSDPIGEFNFDISVYDSDTARIDTVYRSRLSDELGQRLLDQAITDTLTYNNNLEFRKFFDGIALVPDDGNGVVTGIHAESTSTFMRLYYHNSADTLSFSYILQGWDTTGINITKYYNNITLDKSGTPIEGIPDFHTDFQTSDGLTYMQGSSGIFTKLNMGTYLEFLDTIDHLVINRAELVIPVKAYDDYFVPPTELDMYVSDQDNKFVELYDSARQSVSYATIGRLAYAEDEQGDEGRYAGEITAYIQAMTDGTRTDSLLLLGTKSLWNSVINVNQLITAKDEIILNVYYSTLQ